ncbi:MAG TPA: Calx-beta domain-containing protein [Polyangiaceae bacterium]
MSRRAARAGTIAALALACGETDVRVFEPLGIERTPPTVVTEGAGVVEIPVRLNGRHEQRAVARFRALPGEAQNECQTTDFEPAEGGVEWLPDELEAFVRVWVGEDELAETDERFLLELTPGEGLPAAPPVELEIVIRDNDRTALVDAADYGVVPGSESDAATKLQAVLDDAAGFGRPVVTLPPGDYEMSSVRLPTGATLSVRGVRWFRPPASPDDLVTLRVEHAGAENSAPTLVEGLLLDGRRDAQGPYREKERENAHLVAAHGDAERGGRIVASFEALELRSGTGSGVKIGSDADVTLCRISASALWRDAITATGGATRVRIRSVDSTATEGTGLWLGPREPGFEGSLVMDAEAENVLVGAGDVEVESTAGSTVTLRRLTMTRPPFRLDAVDGMVRIVDSVLMLGLSNDGHNHFGPTHDVEITRSTIVASEFPRAPDEPDEPRAFAAVSIVPRALAPSPPAEGPGTLLFQDCRFELAGDVETDDLVYAVESLIDDLGVTVRGGALGAGFVDWFSPECGACVREP